MAHINFLTEAIQSPNVSCCWNGPTAVDAGCWLLVADPLGDFASLLLCFADSALLTSHIICAME